MTNLFGAAVAIALFAAPLSLLAQERGFGVAGVADTSALRIAKYHAILIAVKDYGNGFDKLDEPIRDAEALRDVLTSRYRFDPANVKLLPNPKRETILDELGRLAQELGPNDNLLIFYAGHGMWDEQRQQGYWIPVDARRTSKAGWISNDDIKDILHSGARHTLLIADACFAGSMQMRGATGESEAVGMSRLYALPSRQVMTSGAKETVRDKSVFLDYLVKRLTLNKEPYLPAGDLFSSFRTAVVRNSESRPQFFSVQDVGDEGGEFLFPLRSSVVASSGAGADSVVTADSSANSDVSRGGDTPSTPTDLIRARNRDFVDLIATRDVNALSGLTYSGEPGGPADWKDKLLTFVRSDVTSASLVRQETQLEGTTAVSSVVVNVGYKDPVVAGNRRGTLQFLLRYSQFGGTWMFKSYSLTQKPPL